MSLHGYRTPGRHGDGAVEEPAGISTDTVSESTGGHGVIVEGVRVKDAKIYCPGTIAVDTVSEVTAANGVLVSGCLVKDNAINAIPAHGHACVIYSTSTLSTGAGQSMIPLALTLVDPRTMKGTDKITLSRTGIWFIWGRTFSSAITNHKLVAIADAAGTTYYSVTKHTYDTTANQTNAWHTSNIIALSAGTDLYLWAATSISVTYGGSTASTRSMLGAVFLMESTLTA